MNIRVVNMKNYSKQDEVVILVDRSTLLGNPYKLTSNTESDRKLTIDMYKYDVFLPIVEKREPVSFKFKNNKVLQDKFREEINTIYNIAKTKDVALGCHCKPCLCHADIICDFILSMRREI